MLEETLSNILNLEFSLKNKANTVITALNQYKTLAELSAFLQGHLQQIEAKDAARNEARDVIKKKPEHFRKV